MQAELELEILLKARVQHSVDKLQVLGAGAIRHEGVKQFAICSERIHFSSDDVSMQYFKMAKTFLLTSKLSRTKTTCLHTCASAGLRRLSYAEHTSSHTSPLRGSGWDDVNMNYKQVTVLL